MKSNIFTGLFGSAGELVEYFLKRFSLLWIYTVFGLTMFVTNILLYLSNSLFLEINIDIQFFITLGILSTIIIILGGVYQCILLVKTYNLLISKINKIAKIKDPKIPKMDI